LGCSIVAEASRLRKMASSMVETSQQMAELMISKNITEASSPIRVWAPEGKLPTNQANLAYAEHFTNRQNYSPRRGARRVVALR
jgi:hypothetical protein